MSHGTNYTIPLDSELERAASELFAAAHRFWEQRKKAIGPSAVVWVDDTDGALLIFTRSEYRKTLMQNIEMVPWEHEDPVPFELPGEEKNPS